MSLSGSELDLSKDLANLSEADKRELQQWANNENQKANIQESAWFLPPTLQSSLLTLPLPTFLSLPLPTPNFPLCL